MHEDQNLALSRMLRRLALQLDRHATTGRAMTADACRQMSDRLHECDGMARMLAGLARERDELLAIARDLDPTLVPETVMGQGARSPAYDPVAAVIAQDAECSLRERQAGEREAAFRDARRQMRAQLAVPIGGNVVAFPAAPRPAFSDGREDDRGGAA